MVNFFRIFKILFFHFVVAIFDLVHDVKAMHGLCKLLTASGNLFLNMSDASETAICSFKGIFHISEFAVSQASLIFQKRFPDVVSS